MKKLKSNIVIKSNKVSNNSKDIDIDNKDIDSDRIDSNGNKE